MTPLFYVAAVIWAISAIALLILVMLHSGKGAGLSETFGGGMQTSVGTGIIEQNLNRFTVIAASVFALSVLALMVLWPNS